MMLCIIGRRIPIKILGGLILGGYIYRYTPVAPPLVIIVDSVNEGLNTEQ